MVHRLVDDKYRESGCKMLCHCQNIANLLLGYFNVGNPVSGVYIVENLELGERSGIWGRSHQRVPGSPGRGIRGSSPPEAESFFFAFGCPKGGAIFHITSKFRKLC